MLIKYIRFSEMKSKLCVQIDTEVLIMDSIPVYGNSEECHPFGVTNGEQLTQCYRYGVRRI